MGARHSVGGYHAGISHSADPLARGDRLTRTHILPVGMQDFMKEAIPVSDGNPTACAFSCVLYHAIYRRSQIRMLKIDSTLPSNFIIEVDASVRIGRAAGSIEPLAIVTGNMRRCTNDRRQDAPHHVFPRHIQTPLYCLSWPLVAGRNRHKNCYARRGRTDNLPNPLRSDNFGSRSGCDTSGYATFGDYAMRQGSSCRVLSRALPALTCAALAFPAVAQEATDLNLEKWRPDDGIYAEPGKKFRSSCNDENNLRIDLTEKSVAGYEWSCDIRSTTTLAPRSLRLDMTCSDYNLAQNLYPRDPNWENRRFKEMMLVKRLNAGTVSVQKTLNGKFADTAWRETFCPKETQSVYAEAKREAKEKAKQKAEQELTLKSAHPRDGVYAAAGPDFEDRCAKFDDTIVAFAGKLITTTSNICKIENTRVQLPDTVRIGAACALQAASGPEAASVQDPNTIQDRENLMFKKIDDKAVILWIINNGHFTGEGRTLSFCSDQTQRAYAVQRRTNKQTKN